MYQYVKCANPTILLLGIYFKIQPKELITQVREGSTLLRVHRIPMTLQVPLNRRIKVHKSVKVQYILGMKHCHTTKTYIHQ